MASDLNLNESEHGFVECPDCQGEGDVGLQRMSDRGDEGIYRVSCNNVIHPPDNAPLKACGRFLGIVTVTSIVDPFERIRGRRKD